MDTIFALASARGKSGVAVIRLSGPNAWSAAETLSGPLPSPRVASLRRIRSPQGPTLDEGLVMLFEAGASFTGEPVAEFQIHGSVAGINAVLSALQALPGLRPAEPGEFTRRALENDRMDVAQIEGLADLIDAETEQQRVQAQRVFSGALGILAEDWRAKLIRAAALLEATIDFSDEDVPVDVSPEVSALLTDVTLSLRRESDGSRIAERIRDGFEVAIVGPPNVGKSTLLNALAGREAAITSEFAGTTRDIIEVRMDLRGLPVTLLDTAGVRDTADHVEGLGVARTKSRSQNADIRVFIVEKQGDETILPIKSGDIVVVGKADLSPSTPGAVSGKTGLGIDSLIDRVAIELQSRASGVGTAVRARHRYAIDRAISALESAHLEVNRDPGRAEFAAEDIRTALRALDSLVGRIDVEHILDEIFASFCLGK